MSPDEHHILLKDGRKLGYAQYGDPVGLPVFYFHGFPASRLEGSLHAAAAFNAGVGLIAPDRPGFGLSDFAPKRSILEWAEDIRQLADHLELSKFAILGVSGGGPYALACSLCLAHRTSVTVLVAPLGPIAEGKGSADMNVFARMSFSVARKYPKACRLLYGALLVPLLRRRPSIILSLLQPTAADKPVIDNPEIRGKMQLSIREAFRHGAQGVLHELYLFAQPWGFSLQEINSRIHLWQGGEDGTVPPSMGKFIAEQLPACQYHFWPNEGHFSLAIDHGAEFLEILRESLITEKSL
ncbi:MAG: alpha/beta hydrolase [Desulforhopalus sp.]